MFIIIIIHHLVLLWKSVWMLFLLRHVKNVDCTQIFSSPSFLSLLLREISPFIVECATRLRYVVLGAPGRSLIHKRQTCWRVRWFKVKFELSLSAPLIATIDWIVVNEFEPLLLIRHTGGLTRVGQPLYMKSHLFFSFHFE